MAVNDFAPFLNTFEGMEPFAGYVDKGFLTDFIGQRIDGKFRVLWGVGLVPQKCRIPISFTPPIFQTRAGFCRLA